MILKNFLPNEDYSLISALSTEILHERFNKYVESPVEFRLLAFKGMPKNEYEGEWVNDTFCLRRITFISRNYLLISGVISEFDHKRKISIRIRMENYLIFLSILWFVILGIVSILILIIGAKSGFPFWSFSGLLMFLITYIISFLPLSNEISDVKNFLERLFEGKEI